MSDKGEIMYTKIEDIHGNRVPFTDQDLIHIRKKPVISHAFVAKCRLFVTTPHGALWASAGDYIIKDVRGDLYPCAKEVFEQTYEVVAYEEEEV